MISSATCARVRIPTYPPTYSDNIRPGIPTYPPTPEVLP